MSAYQAARSRLLDDDAELERDEALLSEMLGPKESDVMDALAQVLRSARYAKAQAEALQPMIDDMVVRKQRFLRRNEAMRGVGFAVMDALGLYRADFPDFSASIRNGQPGVVVTDEEKIPDIYTRIERKIDKATILSALKSGLPVEGAELSNPAPTLSLRTK